jgi:hypothetical protein
MIVLLTWVQSLVFNVLEELVDTRGQSSAKERTDPENVVLVPDATDDGGTE